MKLRIGFIGTGEIGLDHVSTCKKYLSDLVEGVAVCDSHRPNLEKAIQILPDTKVFSEAEELLTCDLDAVIISTPNDTHLPLIKKSISAGKHVLVEKPVATTVEDCLEIVDLANNTNLVIMVGHELRYGEIFQEVKRIVKTGEIGEPQLVWCREFRKPFRKKVDDWIQDSQRSGGSLVEKNCHHFDLMNWWIDSKPQYIAGFGGNDVVRVLKNKHEVLDHATVSFEYENGVRGNLILSLFAPHCKGEHLQMGVLGDKGMVETKLSRDELVISQRNDAVDTPIVEVRKINHDNNQGRDHHGFAKEHFVFCEAIKRGIRPLTDVRKCVDGTLLGIAAERSIKEKSVVELIPEIEEAAIPLVNLR